MKRRIAHPRPRTMLPAALTTLITILAAHAALAEAPRPAVRASAASTAGASATAAKPAGAKATPGAPRAAHKHSTVARSAKAGGGLVRASGMKAAIDPATGRLVRPTAEQVQALDAQAGVRRAADDDPARGIPVIRLANGAEIAHLDERFQEFEVARIGADGKLVRSCVQGPDAAAKLRAEAKAVAAKPAREVQ